jgi:hypothetical protein
MGYVDDTAASAAASAAAGKLDTSAAFGQGQTWQNLTSSRAWNTTYTNTTGKPIMVSAYANGISETLATVIDGLEVSQDTGAGNGQSGFSAVCIVVPNGSTYKITPSATPISGYTGWYELR